MRFPTFYYNKILNSIITNFHYILFQRVHYQFMWNIIDPSSERPLHTLPKDVKASLVLLILEFTLDVVAKSQAESCVLAFLKAIEDIIENDQSGHCAMMIVKHLNSHSPLESITSTPPEEPYSKEEIRFVTNSSRWILEYLHLCSNPVLVHAFEKLVQRTLKTALKTASTASAVLISPIVALQEYKEGTESVDANSSSRKGNFLADVFHDSEEYACGGIEPSYVSAVTEVHDVVQDVQQLLNQLLLALEAMSPRMAAHREGIL